MSVVKQIASVTGLGLRSIPSRLGNSLVIVIGVGTVVAVFIAVLAVAAGFERIAANTGRADRAMILSRDASTESASALTRENVEAISNAPGIRHDAQGAPIVSGESLTFVQLADVENGRNVFVTVRGIGAQSQSLRQELKIVAGRMFKPGARELIVGRAAHERFKGMELGSTVALAQGDWPIVGFFESANDSHESEFMTDVATVMSAYRRNTFNSMTVALENPDAFARFSAAVRADRTVAVDVMRETDYFARASRNITQLLRIVALGMGVIMAVGAAFGAISAMYSAVSSRKGEIAILRTLGFGPGGIVTSVLMEALLLALVGAALGAALAWTLFNGASISTITGSTPSQVTFSMQVDTPIIARAVIAACTIGMIGGLLPAVRAGRDAVASVTSRAN